MVDVFPKKLEGEGMDYSHSSVFIGDPKIEYDTGNGFVEYVLVTKIAVIYLYAIRLIVHILISDCNFIIYV